MTHQNLLRTKMINYTVYVSAQSMERWCATTTTGASTFGFITNVLVVKELQRVIGFAQIVAN